MPARAPRRVFSAEFRREAVQMMLDGHSAASVAERLGLAGTNLLYRWKREELERTGPVATSLEGRIRELEIELHRVERERDILPLNASILFPISHRTISAHHSLGLAVFVRAMPVGPAPGTGRPAIQGMNELHHGAILGLRPRLRGEEWTSSTNGLTPDSSRMRCSPGDHSSGDLAGGSPTRE